MAIPRNARDERSVGVSIGSLRRLIAVLLPWRTRVYRAEIIGGLGVFLLICGWPSRRRYP
jgi:hypothetical protein